MRSHGGKCVDYERSPGRGPKQLGEQRRFFSYQLVQPCQAFSPGADVWQVLEQTNIVEGSSSQNPYFGDSYDLRLFCRIGTEEQLQRILRRNGPKSF